MPILAGASDLRLSVARVMALDSFRQKPLSPALPAASQRGAPAFGSHPRAEPVLAFTSSLRWLVGAFHKAEKSAPRELRAVSLGWSGGLSMKPEEFVDPFGWFPFENFGGQAGESSNRRLPVRTISAIKQCKAH